MTQENKNAKEEKKSGGKISVYLEQGTLDNVKLLASYDGISITELVTTALNELLAKRDDDLKDERRRVLEREQRKAQQRKNDE